MVSIRWVIRDGEKILQYRDRGTSTFESTSGVLGTFTRDYDSGWIDVQVEDEECEGMESKDDDTKG